MTQVTAPSSSHPTQESTPQPEDDDEARDREEATRSAWRVLVCCSSSRRGKPTVANDTSSSSVAPIATAASAGFLSTLTNWSLGLKTSKLAKRFHPGPGYERVPLAHSDSDASFADEPETGSISTGPVGRTASRRQGSTRTLAASGSRGSFGSLPEGASLAALAQRLEGLSAVSAVKASLVTTGDVVRLTISGPMRLEYSLDADGYVMEAVRAVNRLPASLFDVNGCPITPVAAMDAMEEVIAKALRSTRGVGIVTSVTLEHIALSSAAAPSSSTLLQRQISTDGDDDGEVVSRRDAALMRARHSKTAALSDHLAAAADAFHSDYTPGEVRQRVRHFVHNVLDAVSSSTLQELVLDHCTFGDAFMLADLLTSPCIPRASRRDRSHPWNGGLHTLELKSCGLTAAHISTLLRELNAVQRGLHPFLEGNLFTVLQHLTLLGMGSASGALPNLLGFIADTAELDGGSQHTGLQDLVIDEELVSVVLKHRLAPFLATINGRRVEDELASR